MDYALFNIPMEQLAMVFFTGNIVNNKKFSFLLIFLSFKIPQVFNLEANQKNTCCIVMRIVWLCV